MTVRAIVCVAEDGSEDKAIRSILLAAAKDSTILEIMNRAFLPHNKAKRHIDSLLKSKFLSFTPSTKKYRITQEGSRHLESLGSTDAGGSGHI